MQKNPSQPAEPMQPTEPTGQPAASESPRPVHSLGEIPLEAYLALHRQGWDPDSISTPSRDPGDDPERYPGGLNSVAPTARPLLARPHFPTTPAPASGPSLDVDSNSGPHVLAEAPVGGAPLHGTSPFPDFNVQSRQQSPQANPYAGSISRDAILSYAYHLYDSPHLQPPIITPIPLFDPAAAAEPTGDTYRSRLLPLLLTLRSLHPTYLPILLLLSSTYYVLGDYEACLTLSHEMLAMDPHYVEAMSNIGTALRAMGREDQAHVWWWKALQLRPMYFDAMDNILAMLFSQAQKATDPAQHRAAYQQALGICQFVGTQLLDDDGRLKLAMPNGELHRLQRLLFTTATLHSLIGLAEDNVMASYFTAVDLVVRPPPPFSDDELYTFRDLVLAMCVAAYMVCATSSGPVPAEIAQSLTADGGAAELSLPFDLFRAVHASADRLTGALLRLGDGALPCVLLLPEEVAHAPMLLFPFSMGVAPAICTRALGGATLDPPLERVRQQTNVMTSTILLTVAKKLQENWLQGVTAPGFGELGVSASLVIILYYLALALAPSPSTYNNIGILLSTLTTTRTYKNDQGGEQLLNGPALAGLYYQAGLKIDPNHPHLLTNLGSLLKDQGQIDQAIELYKRAIEHKPDFDIALANLGNAVKDTGRSWDAIEFYRRATAINPNLPEATCGLTNSVYSVCDWRGRGSVGNEVGVDEVGQIIPHQPGQIYPGWIVKMLEICSRQIDVAYDQSQGVMQKAASVPELLSFVERAKGRALRHDELRRWEAAFSRFFGARNRVRGRMNESGFIIRFSDWLQPRLMRQWYVKAYGTVLSTPELHRLMPEYGALFVRPMLPGNLNSPTLPSVLPFHTFTYPMSARMARLIAHRNALRLSYMALGHPWLPKHVFHPPRPPVNGKIRIGYVSNDVNNHPLSHLMQSVFGMHDRERFSVVLYTTSPWDGTDYRPRIMRGVDQFVDVSSWPANAIIEHIVKSEIHILINLGGYTKGARNDIFAARPCAVQMQLMGYAGTLAAGWCDYLVTDPLACPEEMSVTGLWRKKMQQGQLATADDTIFDLDADADPESTSEEWAYTEKFLYMPHTFMVTDHKQSFRQDEGLSAEDREKVPAPKLWHDEELRRTNLRELYFPDLPRDVIVFANFSQLYKIDPGVYAVWLRILARVPRSILWLLKFPSAGEEHLIRTAKLWAGDEVASRIRFTGVAKKEQHVHRGRVADLFLDTLECNAHTIAADVLWTGTPILTMPKHAHKMCSRVAASMANATGFGDQMVVQSIEEYENRAVALAASVQYSLAVDPNGVQVLHGEGELMHLRRNIFLNRDRMPLFDTIRWTRNFEKGLAEAWRRWVEGTQFELSDEWEAAQGGEKGSGCIWVPDNEPQGITQYS